MPDPRSRLAVIEAVTIEMSDARVDPCLADTLVGRAVKAALAALQAGAPRT